MLFEIGSESVYGLKNHQVRRAYARVGIIDACHWFGFDGQLLGEGDLSREDMRSVAEQNGMLVIVSRDVGDTMRQDIRNGSRTKVSQAALAEACTMIIVGGEILAIIHQSDPGFWNRWFLTPPGGNTERMRTISREEARRLVLG